VQYTADIVVVISDAASALMDRAHDEGVEEGIDRGKAELLLKALKARGLEPSDAQREQAASITEVFAG
jgi:hypothetical protein